MNHLTAEIVDRRREAEERSLAQRQQLRGAVRDARERLTSSVGLSRLVEYELLRLFAQSRASASVALAVYTIGISFALHLWLAPALTLAWTFSALLGVALNYALARHFLKADAAEVRAERWRGRFLGAEAVQSLGWSAIAPLALAAETREHIVFVLIALLLYGAINALLSASVRVVVHAGLLPVSAGLALLSIQSTDMQGQLVSMLALGTVVFCAVLANRMHASAIETIAFRSEKDALILELEEATAKHDEARRRAEEANLAKSRFLATMSHELRTPLNAILGFSEVMKSELYGPHSVPQYREYAADIHGSGQHLLQIINEILDLSRIEAGRYELQEEAVDLTNTVDDCLHMLELRARNKAITLQPHLETGLARLWADERAVRQITINLLGNAIKFTPSGGTVTIKVGWTAAGGQYISIRDTGPGIPEEEIPVVLDSFGRGALAIKTAEQGTGLGLPIVKGLVDLHGGRFLLKSKLREGTEVIVLFPPERVMEALAAVPAPRAA